MCVSAWLAEGYNYTTPAIGRGADIASPLPPVGEGAMRRSVVVAGSSLAINIKRQPREYATEEEKYRVFAAAIRLLLWGGRKNIAYAKSYY
jgi:hypothetical protein